MSPENVGVFIPIIVPIAIFAMIFGIRYLENKENLSMIEKGIAPPDKKRRASHPMQVLKWGLLFMGIGLGLAIALIISESMQLRSDEIRSLLFFTMALLGGGGGLVTTYMIARKHPEKDGNQ